MKTITLGSTTITLQLWDTAGQERSDSLIDHLSSYFLPSDKSFFFLHLWVLFFSFHQRLSRFRSITEQYYRKADGILAMYDITHSPSFTAVRGWMDSVKVSRWRCHGWLDVKTCKTVFPLFWIHFQVIKSSRTVVFLEILLKWFGFFLSDVYVDTGILWLHLTLMHIKECVLLPVVSVPGEDVWRCSTDAAGEQAGPGRCSQQKRDNKRGTEVGRGKAYLNIQTTFCCDLFMIPLLRKEFFFFFFNPLVHTAAPGFVLRMQRQDWM